MEDYKGISLKEKPWVEAAYLLIDCSYIPEMKRAFIDRDEIAFKEVLDKYNQTKNYCNLVGVNGDSFENYDDKIAELKGAFKLKNEQRTFN